MRTLLPVLLAISLLAAQDVSGAESVRVSAWLNQETAESAGPLRAEEVAASLAGETAPVRKVLGPRDGLMLLLVTDVVGDLMLAGKAKQALAERIEGLPDNVWVGLLRAQDGLKVKVDPTPERKPVTDAIRTLPVSGRAGLLETIVTAAGLGDAVLARAGVRVAVLYVTDSDVRNYREDFSNPVINGSDYRDMSRRFPDALIRDRISKLETALVAHQTPVFIVHLAYRSERLNEAYQTGLMRLAAATGGTSAFCRSQIEIPEAIAAAFETISSHYSIEVSLPEAAPRSVEITLSSPGRSLTHRNRFTK
ncbi:MAG: hypothetical protein IT159_12115 [Bryobacterales bacterium]|nr:hypothetical protein [Bryobacterales bacterium]